MTESTIHKLEEALRDQSLAALIEAVATKSANEAVGATFFLLGVDLKDVNHVRSTRDVITRMRDRFQAEEARRDAWSKGAVHGVITIIAGVIMAGIGFIMTGNWPHTSH